MVPVLPLEGTVPGTAVGGGAIGGDLGSGSDHEGTSLLNRTDVLF